MLPIRSLFLLFAVTLCFLAFVHAQIHEVSVKVPQDLAPASRLSFRAK